ncbi:MAG: hypothetical protein IAE77_07080 [Prosthecobacter sp.]|nr:hypothetical protein [Prosthecobacter sp.]MBE2283207.1 hypothetical protein [Prosthecobacter sp.]
MSSEDSNNLAGLIPPEEAKQVAANESLSPHMEGKIQATVSGMGRGDNL